jgi:ribosomal protein S18 acetylase RimI-like enzyme
MHIEPYQGTEHQPLAQAFSELYRHYFGESAPAFETIFRYLKDEILAPNSSTRVVVAKDEKEIAGLATYAILHPAPGAHGQLFMKDLYVRSAWRNRGVGEMIMEFLAQHAVSNGCLRFDWTTESGNPGAISFYERLGASRIAEKVYFRLSGADLLAFAARNQGA